MKKKEFNELKKVKKIDLVKQVSAKKVELVQIIGKIHTGREKNLKKAKNLRRDIAQMMTVLSATHAEHGEKKDTTKKDKIS